MTPRDPDPLLVLRAQAGDRKAFDELLRTIQAPLCRYVRVLVLREDWVKDVLQDTFLLIVRKLGWLHDPRLFRPWAFRIASREAFRRLTRERRWQSTEPIAELVASDPAAEECDVVLLARLPELLDRLSPASRAVVHLHYLDELSLSSVAAVLGIPPGTAKSRLAYGLRCLRHELEGKPS